MGLLAARTGYSRAERISDAAIHVSGLAAVLIAVPVLVTLAVVLRGDAPAVVGVSIYGAALVGMILFSALYNLADRTPWAGILRRLDHSAIFVKIAGTYTPFTLMTGSSPGLLAALWGAAGFGVGLKLVAPDRTRWICIALSLGMGWASVLAGGGFLAALPPSAVVLVLSGGALYTLGVVFYLWERLPFHYTIWHVLVLTASLAFYAAVMVTLLDAPLPLAAAAPGA